MRPAPSASAAARLSEPRADGLAERRDLAGRLGGKRAGAQLARAAVGVAEALEARLAVAHRREGDAGAQLDLCGLERDVEAAVDLDRAGQLLGRRLVVALERARSRRSRARARRARTRCRSPRRSGQRLRAGVRARPVAAAREELRGPVQPPDREVVVLAVLPALEERAQCCGGLVVRPLGRGDVRQAAVESIHMWKWPTRPRRGQRGDEHAPGRRELALEGVDRRRASPSATQTAVSVAIRSRLISAARAHSPRSRRT